MTSGLTQRGKRLRAASAAALLALALGGCSSTQFSAVMADSIPHWAGGLPQNAPPRPGEPRYAEYYKSQLAARQTSEQKRLADAKAREQDARIEHAQVAAGFVQRSQSARSVMRERSEPAVAMTPEPEQVEASPRETFSLTGRALY